MGTIKQIEFLANIVRLYRGKEPEFLRGSDSGVSLLGSSRG